MNEPFIIEAVTVEQANAVDQAKYRFERFSDTRNCYIFIRRRGA